MTATAWNLEVGQKVWLHDVNARGRGPTRGTVTKLGNKLVTIRDDVYNYENKYRIAEQTINDNYSHYWFRTDEQELDDNLREEAKNTLREHGLEIPFREAAIPTNKLMAIAKILEDPALDI